MESGIQNRILKSGIQPLMESGINGCGIRNPQTWNLESTACNPESKTLVDYLGAYISVLHSTLYLLQFFKRPITMPFCSIVEK